MLTPRKPPRFVRIPTSHLLPQTPPPPRLRDFLARLPVKRLRHVAHCGDPEKHEPAHRDSLEGCLLSVSTHPDAWKQITHVGHHEWRLSLKTGPLVFVDFRRIRPQQRKTLTITGVRRGLVTPVSRYRASFYDSEADEMRYSDHLTSTEAQEQYEGDPTSIRQLTIPHATATLDAYWTVRGGNTAGTNNAEEALLSYLSEWCGVHHGIWWDDLLAPELYSAPRGGIFQSAVEHLRIIKSE